MLPQVCSVGYWDAAHDQAWGLGEHRNEGIEITYLANGRLGRVDGSAHPLGPGDLTITRPWQPHSVGDPAVASSRLYWLILDVGVRQPHQAWQWPSWLVFSKADLRDLTALLRENEHPVWRAARRDRTMLARSAGWRTSPTGDPPVTRLVLAINELLVCVHELCARKTRRARSVSPWASAAWRCFSSASVSASPNRGPSKSWPSAPAWAAPVSPTIAGNSPTWPRWTTCGNVVEEAKSRLTATDAPVTDIALDCGFGSSAYFASVFRSAVQCTPSQYRTRLIAGKTLFEKTWLKSQKPKHNRERTD